MPTPTVSRPLSPALELANGDHSIPSSLQSTSQPIPIPSSDPSDPASKFPSLEPHVSARTIDCPWDFDATTTQHRDRIGDCNIAPTLPRFSDHGIACCASIATPPRPSALLGTTPPIRTSLSPHESSPRPATTGSLAPTFARRPWEVAGERIPPTVTSSFLRPYSRYVGKQKSDKATYNVEVELKYVDMARSSLSGFLRIEGLTEHLPTITTYFEGEMIGSKYTFITPHPSWGSNEKTDETHWERFREFHSETASKLFAPDYCDKRWSRRPHIFMRWKEQFLVPDHRRTHLEGASFDGFYYIVFNQCSRTRLRRHMNLEGSVNDHDRNMDDYKRIFERFQPCIG